MYLLQNAYVAQMVMHMCIICNPLVHLCKSIFFRCDILQSCLAKYSFVASYLVGYTYIQRGYILCSPMHGSYVVLAYVCMLVTGVA